MARRNKYAVVEDLLVSKIGAEGKVIAYHEERVVFLTNAVPGDIVDAQITKKRSSFLEGRITKFKKFSEHRIEPVCEHFGICGGCKWQMLPYSEQLKYKQQQVVDQLTRIGKLKDPPIRDIIGSAQTEYYRNKLEFTFSNKRWLTKEEIDNDSELAQRNALGFHVPGLFDKVVDVNKCWLQEDPSNDIRIAVRDYAIDNNLKFFDIRDQSGLLRNLIIRTSTTGDVMCIVSFFRNEKEKIDQLLSTMHTQFPQISSLQYVINAKKNDTILDQDIKVFSGSDHIVEEMEDLKFKIGPKSFYQTNSKQAYELYKVVRELAGLSGKELVYDLYTGIGTIANFVARQAKKVVGIEYVPEAIEDARRNATDNGLDNTVFYAGDMKDVLVHEMFEIEGKPDVIILDPPRAGIHESVVRAMLEVKPEKIVYVSCNPATQARDIALLAPQYEVSLLQPIDMFPHTHHVENIALLNRISHTNN